MAMEVLTKGPILDWTSNGKLHERFLEWKKKVSVLCKGLRILLPLSSWDTILQSVPRTQNDYFVIA